MPFDCTKNVLPHEPQVNSIAQEPKNISHTALTDGILISSVSFIVLGLTSSSS